MRQIKVFRDPIYNLITFDKEFQKPLLELIDCPEFQRLKRIKQLGLSYYTYPSAVHCRFSHSLGVAYLTGIIVDCLDIPKTIEVPLNGKKINLDKEEFKLLMQMAAILHDVGHGPFSHAFEKISGINHENISIQIINSNTAVNNVLRNLKSTPLKENSVQWITDILDGTFELVWAKDLISSQIDADRIDYLIRDAYMCGVKYVNFDWEWLLNNMEVREIPQEDKRKGVVINAQKGLYALESFIISRYHMYEQVYFHKTTRCVEGLILKIFDRIKLLLAENKKLPFVSESLEKVIVGNYVLDDFLALDDFEILTQIKIWQNYDDEILKKLSIAITNRKLFKMFKESINQAIFSRSDYQKLDSIFPNNESDYLYFEDDYVNNPYKDDYLLGKKEPEQAGHIWLSTSDGKIKELAIESQLVNTLRQQTTKKVRGYIHRDYLEKAKDVLK